VGIELIFMYSVVLLIAGVLSLFFIRILMRYFRAKKNSEQKDTSKVSFVVDTFHDLVSQLKEKEKELDVLRKKAEDRAIAIAGYNENILQSVPSGVISFDEEMRITKVNLSAEKILEIKGKAVVGKYHTEVLNKPITDFLRDRRVIERGEFPYITPSGKKIWLGHTLSPLKDKDGRTIGRILIFTDLTHLKAIESQIELRNKLSSLGEISAGIAHELRNPMGVIAGYTKLLSKKADVSMKPTVDAISGEIVVMDRIISDFLSFAKPMDLSLSDVDLQTVIENCVASTINEQSNIQVKLDLRMLPVIKGDEVLLRQAFTNLVQNSAEAMQAGGELAISASVQKAADGGFLDILISDTGHGISDNIKNKIFLPFFTTKEKGTGLGLALVHKIVVSHGGNISVESSEKGTTFRIRLPFNSK